jgi:teichuronic acid biosynthesis glycosyltransferase TuaH
MPDLVFTFSYVSWQAAAARGWFMPEDRLARALVSEPRIDRLLVSDLVRSLPAKLARDAVARARGGGVPFPSEPSRRLLQPVRLRRDYPTSIAGVERACARYDRQLERAARQMGLREPAVITGNPLMAGFGAFKWAGPVTFFAHDDWLAYPLHRQWWPAYEESFARLRATERRVCAVSSAAMARIDPAGPAVVVPNGIDPQEWSGPPASAPGWAGELRRPLLAYVGSLDERIDVAALAALACELPEATLLLVGPLLDPDHLAPLRELGNVEIRDPLGRSAVAALIRSADVGLIPHVSSPLTRAMSPLKLYEYLAGGLPVVAADLPPVHGVDAGVRLVEPGGDYAVAVREALQTGPAPEQQREAFIEANSWSRRIEQLLDLALA